MKWVSTTERNPTIEELPCLVWRSMTHQIEIGRPMPPIGEGKQDMWMPLPEPPSDED